MRTKKTIEYSKAIRGLVQNNVTGEQDFKTLTVDVSKDSVATMLKVSDGKVRFTFNLNQISCLLRKG